MGQKVDSVTVTVTHYIFGWTHCLRLHGIRVLVLCSLCRKVAFIDRIVLLCRRETWAERIGSCTTSSRLDAHRKFTLYCCLLQWSVPSQMDQPRSQNLQMIRNQFAGFVLAVLSANGYSVCDARTDGRFRSVPTYHLNWSSEQVED
jgi:hypothetical protein